LTPRARLLSESEREWLDSLSDGAMPSRSVAAMVTTMTNATTRASKRVVRSSGSVVVGTSAERAPRPHQANPSPTGAPGPAAPTQNLPNQPRPARAERHANAHPVVSWGSTREQQIGEIG